MGCNWYHRGDDDSIVVCIGCGKEMLSGGYCDDCKLKEHTNG